MVDSLVRLRGQAKIARNAAKYRIEKARGSSRKVDGL